MLIPGETALHYFTIPFKSTDINKIIVTYKQRGYIVFEKEVTSSTSGVEFIADGDKTNFMFRLTQAESLQFMDDEEYSVQLNVMMNDSNRFPSIPVLSRTGPQHIREVINNAG